MKNLRSPLFAVLAFGVVLLAGLLFAGKPSVSVLATAADASAPALVAALPAAALTLAASVFVLFCLAGSVRGVRGWRALLTCAAAILGGALYRFTEFVGERMTGLRTPWVKAVSVYTQIADLWVPAVWQQGQMELQVNQPNIFRSPLVVTGTEVTQAVNGVGVSVNIPFIIAPRPASQPQRERVAPDITKLGSGLQVAAIYNRASPLGATALSRVIAGPDPVKAILMLLDDIRTWQFQTTLFAQLTGLFALGSTPNQGVGAFRALRLDQFLEDGAAPLNANLIDSPMLLDAVGRLGERAVKLVGGYIFMHTDISTALKKQDLIDFVKNSSGEILYAEWKGMKVVIDDTLVRAGGTSGNVYITLIAVPGSIAFEQRPQVFTDKAGEVAAVQMDLTQISTNDVVIYDRTRCLMHPQGAKWIGTPTYTDAGAIDADFATPANWNLALNDVKNTGIVAIRTNG